MNDLKHGWDLSPKQAIELQKRLNKLLILEDNFDQINTVAGVDVGFEQQGSITRAAVCLLKFPSLERKESALYRYPTIFPYIPGLLSFREVPAILGAFDQLSEKPDLLLCDGQGYAHPRRLGIACHLGLLMDTPSIGVAKSRLIGQFEEPEVTKGSCTPLIDKDEIIGTVLRSRSGVKPLFISPGHRIGFESAVSFVMACLTRYRLPETTRCAHKLASG